MTRDPIGLLRTLHRRLAASGRAVEIQAAQAVEVVRRLILLGKTDGLRHMAEAGRAWIEDPAEPMRRIEP